MSRPPIGALGAVALLAVGGLVSGCGASANAHSLRMNGPITKTEAITYAQAVNLTPADMPGMVSVSREKESKPGRGDIEEARCTGRPSPTQAVVTITSPQLRSGSGLQLKGIKSGVAVRPSAALATRSLAAVQAAVHNARARRCLLRLAAKGFAKGFAHGLDKGISFSLGRVAISPLPHSLSRSFAVRIVIPLSFARPGSVPFHTHVYVDALGFVTGPAEISLTATGFSSPVPTATEQRLLSLLYSRAKT